MSIISAITKIISRGGGGAGGKAASKVLGKSAGAGGIGIGGLLTYDALKGIMSSNDNNKNQASNDNNLTGSMGMAGSAGRQSTSSTSMPSFASTPAVRASANASQRDLMLITVKLLGSIDASIKEQNKQQRFIASQQQLQQRESQVEMSGGGVSRLVGGMGSRLASRARGPLESIVSNTLLGITAYSLFKAKSMGEIANSAFEMIKTVGAVLAGTGLVVSAVRGGRAALGDLAEKFNPKSQRYHVSEGPNKGRFFKPEKATQAAKGALKGVMKAGAKGGLLGAAFEALGYILDPSSMTGRNLAGSFGAILGGIGGAALGAGWFSLATGVAGSLAGESLATGLYDLIAGSPPSATPPPNSRARGKITPELLSKTPQELSDAEIRSLVLAQGRIEDPSGVMNNPGGIRYGTGTAAVREHQIDFKQANDDASVKIAVYDTFENGVAAAILNWKTNKNYRGRSISDGLGMWTKGKHGKNAKYESWLTGLPATEGDEGAGALALEGFTSGVRAAFEKIPATNLMKTEQLNQKPPNDTIAQQAAAMETATRSQNRAVKLAIQSITPPQVARQVAQNNSGGAQSVPSPGYGVAGDGGIVDMLVYFGLAKAA